MGSEMCIRDRVDAMAQQTVKAGGVGLADSVLAQMIKMQEQGA